MILRDVGEIGVFTPGGEWFKLRPSLYAMSQLGEPGEIVRLFASVMAPEPHRDQFPDALAVLHACAEQDVSEVFGCYEPEPDSRLKYRPGLADPLDFLPLARCLLKHGIVGALPPLPRPADAEEGYSREFHAREMVDLAVAHLGLPAMTAWGMTMTEIAGALRAKFPPTDKQAPGRNAPTGQEHDALMAWADRIAEKRKKGGK